MDEKKRGNLASQLPNSLMKMQDPLNDPSRKQKERPDIIFAYANVFGHMDDQKEFKPYDWSKIINPDEMFKKIE